MGTSERLPELAADGEPVQARQHQVEQHDVETLAPGCLEGTGAVARAGDDDPVSFEVLGGQPGQSRIVLDQQGRDEGLSHSRRHRGPCISWTFSTSRRRCSGVRVSWISATPSTI